MSGELCNRCRKPSVVYQRYSGRHMCAEHLAADILVRVKRTIRLQGGLGKKRVIAVFDEGFVSTILLFLLLQVIGSRPEMEIILFHSGMLRNEVPENLALPPGIRYRREQFCPGTIVEAVTRSGVDRVVRCSTLDEEAAAVLCSLLSGCSSLRCDRLDYSPLLCLTPLREIPLSELILYATYKGISLQESAFTGQEGIGEFLTSLTKNHPSIPFSLINYRDKICELGSATSDTFLP